MSKLTDNNLQLQCAKKNMQSTLGICMAILLPDRLKPRSNLLGNKQLFVHKDLLEVQKESISIDKGCVRYV